MTNTKSQIPNSQLLAEAIRFEHWARFHCMREIPANNIEENTPDVNTADINTPNINPTGENTTSEAANENMSNVNSASNMSDENTTRAIIQIPEILIGVSQEDEPHLSALLERIQNTDISLDSARTHILAFLKETLKLDDDAFMQEIQKISASKKFARYLDVFYTFVQEEAELEEQELTAKEAEIGVEAMAQYIEEAPIPTFSTWTEKFYQWASQRNFRLELE